MKKILLFTIAVFLTLNVNGQAITDTGDKVGISDDVPNGKLTIKNISQFDFNLSTNGGYIELIDRATLTNPMNFDLYARNGLFRFFTGTYTERMCIINNGNVGIGTTSPIEKLEVKDGNFRLSNLTGVAYGSLGKIDFYNYASAASVVSARIEGKRDSYSHKDGRLSFYTSDIDGNLNEQLTIDKNGNIGIGTTSPGGKLDIFTSATQSMRLDGDDLIIYAGNFTNERARMDLNGGNGRIFLYDNSNNKNVQIHGDDISYFNGGNVGIGNTDAFYDLDIANPNGSVLLLSRNVGDAGSVLGYIYFGNRDVNSKLAYIKGKQDGASSKGSLSFFTADGGGAIERLIINSSGNVGIGTATAQYKLTVEGIIGAREVVVTSDAWADFVFEDDYNLMSLKDLDKYIQANKHLPEIPTTAEVEENGISIGEMNAKLLQKIEELTLYTIEQQKVIETLVNRVEQLENK